MPQWDEYKQIAKGRGALALELYVITSTPTAPPEAVKAVLAEHLAYQRKLEEQGTLVLAGPLSDETGTQMQGSGMMIYRAESMEAATAMAEADPMHQQAARSFTLRKWLVNEGTINLSVGLSTGQIRFS